MYGENFNETNFNELDSKKFYNDQLEYIVF
jgi:hypothetical protein